MKIQNQLIKHDPANGKYGDCYRTCLAVLLDMDAADVPHFYEKAFLNHVMHTADWRTAMNHVAINIQNWLAERGLVEVYATVDGEQSVEDALHSTLLNVGIPFMFSGTSRLGCNHATVALNGEIVCDPSGNGIVGPMDDGNYWITYLGRKLNSGLV